jgi:peptide/nickel transport system permease protein
MTAQTLPSAGTRAASHPRWAETKRFVRRVTRRKTATFGLVIVLLFVVVAALAPLLAPYDPIQGNWGAIRKAPSAAHWLGTDELGRDMLSRIIWGARASLLAGVVSVMIALALGVPVGLMAGYAGGWVEGATMRFVDAMLAIPFLILAIAMATFLGPSLTNAMIAIGFAAMPAYIRLTRGQVISAKHEDYVEAARALGNPPLRIAVRHILPNVMPPIMVQASLTIAGAIIAEAALSFLGLGQQPPQPSWGSMLNSARSFLSQAPWMALSPGAAIFFVVLAFNMFGDGLRDALDPRD